MLMQNPSIDFISNTTMVFLPAFALAPLHVQCWYDMQGLQITIKRGNVGWGRILVTVVLLDHVLDKCCHIKSYQ